MEKTVYSKIFTEESELVDKINTNLYNINKKIFKNEITPSGSAEKIAKKTGAAEEVFNTLHTVTRKQFEEGVSYIELKNSNVDKLKNALK